MKEKIFSNLDQVGFVVKDLDKTIQMLKDIMGIEPVFTGEGNPANARYYGKETQMSGKLGIFRFNNIDLEFIQPVSGENIYDDFIKSHGEGIHHIRFKVDSIEEANEYMKSKGIGVAQSGDTVFQGSRWTYYDSEEALKFIIEVYDEGK